MTFPALLHISPGDRQSLHIFHTESHPSMMGIGSRKEGYSLLAMLDRCTTALGKKLLQKWMLTPMWDPPELTRRQDMIQAFIGDAPARQYLQGVLCKVCNPSTLATTLATSTGLPALSDIRKLRTCLTAVDTLAQYIEEEPLSAAARAVIATLSSVFDLEGFGAMGIVVPGHEELDGLKHQCLLLPDLLKQVADREVARVPNWLAEAHCPALTLSCHFCSAAGFLVLAHGAALPQPVLDSVLIDYEVWSSEAELGGHEGVLYRCDSTRMLDEHLGDIEQEIETLEADLAQQVLVQVRDVVLEFIGPYMPRIAELDVIVALAEVSAQHMLMRPELSSHSEVAIEKGWHPLAATLVECYHPNPTAMGSSEKRVMIITGPNGSGKSMYLRQVGLIVYLTHIGMFVPAAKARIGRVDRIMTRLHAPASKHQSSFMQDIGCMHNMLRACNDRTLLLVDEFGKGTLPVDGTALVLSVVRHLSLLPVPPLVLFATHCYEVSDPAMLPMNHQLCLMNMAIYRDPSSASAEEIIFLYKLAPGTASASFAEKCLATAGVPQHVLQRLKQVQECIIAKRPLEAHRPCRERLDALSGHVTSQQVAPETAAQFTSAALKAWTEAAHTVGSGA